MLVLKPGVSKVRLDELAFSPDGGTIAAPVGHHGFMLWTALTNGAKPEVVKTPIVCKRLTFTPDSATLYAGNDSLCAFDLASRKAERLPITPWHSLWYGLSLDGSRLVIAEQQKSYESCRVTGWAVGDHREPLWEVSAPSQVYSHPLFPSTDAFILSELRWNDARVQIAYRITHSISTGAELDVSAPLVDIPELVTLSPDGCKLACRTREVIRIYPAHGSWKEVPTITNDSKKHFTGIAFHPSGKYLAATSNDETVKLYDISTWEVAKTFTWDIGRMRSIAFSPDGTLAAAGSDKGKVVVWDVDL